MFFSRFLCPTSLPLYSRRASFSQSNNKVDIAAPGVSVTSTVVGGGYASSTGTSMSTPHVTGAIARVWSVCRSCSASQVEQCLLNTASKSDSRTNDLGYGLVRAERAYTCLVETVKCCAQEATVSEIPVDEDFPDPVPREVDPEPLPIATVPTAPAPTAPAPTAPAPTPPAPTPPAPTPPVPTPPTPTAPTCRRRQAGEPCRRDAHCCSQKCDNDVLSLSMLCSA